MADRPIGVCLVGCGGHAAVHAGLLAREGAAALFFVSRTPSRAEEYAGRFSGLALPSLEAACEDPRVDALAVCTPHDRHRADAEAALRSGKAVLLEKPLGVSVEEGELLRRLAGDSGGRLLLAENYAFLPVVPAAIRLLRQGGVGRPRSARFVHRKRFQPAGWRLEKARMGGGLLMDVGPHHLRLLQTLLGPVRRVRWVSSERGIEAMEGESSFTLALDFGEGLEGALEASWTADWDRSVPNLLIEGEAGSLSYVMDRPYLEWEKETLRRVPFDASDPLGRSALVRHFLEVARGAPPAVDAEKGLEDLRVIEAAYRSARTGAWEKSA